MILHIFTNYFEFKMKNPRQEMNILAHRGKRTMLILKVEGNINVSFYKSNRMILEQIQVPYNNPNSNINCT